MDDRAAMMGRRTFLATASAVMGTLAHPPYLLAGDRRAAAVPIIDAHIHLFDPNRPQGAPYNGPRVPGQPPIAAYPERYRQVVAPHGSVGAIVVEASPWVEDNLWVLEVAQRDPIIVGVVGNLEPDKPEFPEYFGRYARNPLYRGIRYGNLWGRDISAQVDNPRFLEGVRLVAEADLVFETANPRLSLLTAIMRLSDSVPELRVVLDHLPNYVPIDAERQEYDSVLRELGSRPQIYCKLTEILRRVDGEVPTDLAFYRDHLDQLAGTFGEDRLIFGSDWPNSDGYAPIENVFRLATEYFAGRSEAAVEKFFWRNSVGAYGWIRRDGSQPEIGMGA